MQFNSGKCKVMHFGAKNPHYCYTMGGYAPGGQILKSVREEKDVGVMISDLLIPSSQCVKAAKKANTILGQMSRAVHYRDKNTWISLYKTYVRCQLEYCVQAWSPWTKKDIDLLESVQQRAVRITSGLLSQNYEDRLKELGLLSLVERRERGDMIETWKILHRVEDIDPSTLFSLSADVASRNTRQSSDPLNIVKPASRLEIRRNFFSVRVCDSWNALPLDIRMSGTLNSFKNNYDSWIKACL